MPHDSSGSSPLSDAGADAAFDAVVRTHYAALANSVFRVVRSQTDTEDILQEVLLAAWQRRTSIPQGEALLAYLFRATRNRAINHLRNRRVRARHEDHTADPDLDLYASRAPDAVCLLQRRELQMALGDAIAELAPRAREIFLLSRDNGLSYVEIGETLGISIKTVETQMSRALKALRLRLATYRE